MKTRLAINSGSMIRFIFAYSLALFIVKPAKKINTFSIFIN
jgi:hypothetical protein